MATDDASFYFYSFYGFGKDEKKINLGTLLKNKDITKECKKISVESNTGKSINAFYIEKQGPNYIGKIARSKPTNAFFSESRKILSDLKALLRGNARIGEKERDIVHFVFSPRGEELIALVEVGFQKPRSGVLREFFERFFGGSISRINFRPERTPKTKNNLDLIRKKPFKELKLKFKRDPELKKGIPIEDALISLTTNNDLEIAIQIKASKKKEGKILQVQAVLAKLFGQNIIEEYNNFDWPGLLTAFEIEAFEGTETSEYTHVDLLEEFDRITIQLNKLTILQNEKELFNELIKKLEEKFPDIEKKE